MALRAQEVTDKIQRQIKKEQRKQVDRLKHTRFGERADGRVNRFNSQTRSAVKSQSSLQGAELPRRRLPSYNSGKASSKVRKAAPKRSVQRSSQESLQPQLSHLLLRKQSQTTNERVTPDLGGRSQPALTQHVDAAMLDPGLPGQR